MVTLQSWRHLFDWKICEPEKNKARTEGDSCQKTHGEESAFRVSIKSADKVAGKTGACRNARRDQTFTDAASDAQADADSNPEADAEIFTERDTKIIAEPDAAAIATTNREVVSDGHAATFAKSSETFDSGRSRGFGKSAAQRNGRCKSARAQRQNSLGAK